jgi:hypothetical protein
MWQTDGLVPGNFDVPSKSHNSTSQNLVIERMSWPSDYHLCFVFGSSWVQMSTLTLAVPIGFP